VLIIDENRNGETIAAAIGDAIEVRLAENATTGFRWKLISPCAPACAITGETRRPAATAAPGAGGEHHWQLQASAAGECEFKGSPPLARCDRSGARIPYSYSCVGLGDGPQPCRSVHRARFNARPA
jgi:predicted secreted protein